MFTRTIINEVNPLTDPHLNGNREEKHPKRVSKRREEKRSAEGANP